MKFAQNFHLQWQLKNENFSLISLTYVYFPYLFVLSNMKTNVKAMETQIQNGNGG